MRYPGSELYPEILSQHFKTIIFVDCETTGFDSWRNEIITMSMSAVDYFSLERKASIELTFKPHNLKYWGAGAEAVHGISVSQALYFEDKKTATDKAMDFLSIHCGERPQIMVCHAFDKYRTGSLYDVNMIMGHMEKMGRRWDFYKHLRFFQSTESYFREARRRGYYRSGGDLFKHDDEEAWESKDFKLGTLCQHYRIPLNHHEAKSDREACESLYRIARSLGHDEGDTVQFNLQGENHGEGGASEKN